MRRRGGGGEDGGLPRRDFLELLAGCRSCGLVPLHTYMAFLECGLSHMKLYILCHGSGKCSLNVFVGHAELPKCKHGWKWRQTKLVFTPEISFFSDAFVRIECSHHLACITCFNQGLAVGSTVRRASPRLHHGHATTHMRERERERRREHSRLRIAMAFRDLKFGFLHLFFSLPRYAAIFYTSISNNL